MRIHTQLSHLFCGLAILSCFAAVPAAYASERESMEQLRTTTLNLIQLLVEEGVLSKDKAETLIKQAEAAKQPAAPEKAEIQQGDANVVRVQYVPKFVQDQIREEIKQEVMARAQAEGWAAPGTIPGWLDRIEWAGDLRLRYELDKFSKANTLPNVFKSSSTRNSSIDNTTVDRDRLRVRARLGANVKINDWLSGGIRMTTGSTSDPVSPNQTLNTKDSKYLLSLDRAFLKAKPRSWLTFNGGRFTNPFFSTDLVWDSDLAFDGIAAGFSPRLSDSWSVFSTFGAFPIEEVQASDTNKTRDKWLIGAQAGLEWKSASQSSVKFGVALYDFKHIEGGGVNVLNGVDSTYNGTVTSFRQKGNNTFDINKDGAASCGGATTSTGCGLASKFRELNLTGQIDLATFNPVHVIFTGDYVRNLGFDPQEILRRTNNTYKKENQGYQFKLTVGMPDVLLRNDWQVFGAYKRLEADAVVDAYTDSDFHLGGTDTKGWIVGGSYGLEKNTSLGLRWISANEISGLPLAIDVLQLDLNAKF